VVENGPISQTKLSSGSFSLSQVVSMEWEQLKIRALLVVMKLIDGDSGKKWKPMFSSINTGSPYALGILRGLKLTDNHANNNSKHS
jgi:hypothetical protein